MEGNEEVYAEERVGCAGSGLLLLGYNGTRCVGIWACFGDNYFWGTSMQGAP